MGDRNPFNIFFERGLNVSLSTDDPLQFHHLTEPLLEEYSVAKKKWDFTGTDVAEIMRNSVLQSGLTHKEKTEFIAQDYEKLGNKVEKTDVPDCRAAFRRENLREEYYWIYKKTDLSQHPDDVLVTKDMPFILTKEYQNKAPSTWWDLVITEFEEDKLSQIMDDALDAMAEEDKLSQIMDDTLDAMAAQRRLASVCKLPECTTRRRCLSCWSKDRRHLRY